jgi:hypothetical protein
MRPDHHSDGTDKYNENPNLRPFDSSIRTLGCALVKWQGASAGQVPCFTKRKCGDMMMTPRERFTKVRQRMLLSRNLTIALMILMLFSMEAFTGHRAGARIETPHYSLELQSGLFVSYVPEKERQMVKEANDRYQRRLKKDEIKVDSVLSIMGKRYGLGFRLAAFSRKLPLFWDASDEKVQSVDSTTGPCLYGIQVTGNYVDSWTFNIAFKSLPVKAVREQLEVELARAFISKKEFTFFLKEKNIRSKNWYESWKKTARFADTADTSAN